MSRWTLKAPARPWCPVAKTTCGRSWFRSREPLKSTRTDPSGESSGLSDSRMDPHHHVAVWTKSLWAMPAGCVSLEC
jgi:hypothetical protein